MVKKILIIMKKHGIIRGTRILFQKFKNLAGFQSKDIFVLYNFLTFPKKESSIDVAIKNDSILWFIPDFGIGSGGHLNIFRMIHNLEKLGVTSDLAICGTSQWINENIARDTICKNFFSIKSKIFFVNSLSDIEKLPSYKIAFATSWETAYFVNTFSNCAKKAYFVQDFEPYFYPVGSRYIFAENTYQFAFEGVTAGSWLSHKLSKEYGMKCIDYTFSYDKNLYVKREKKDNKKRIFFYARPNTDRRGFELGLVALNELYKKDNSIEIILAGSDTSEYEIPFKYINFGVLDIDKLSEVYSNCSLALILSFTNLSLLPLELLASGCPVVINSGENNSWIDKDLKMMIYTEPNVTDIVDNISNILYGNISFDWSYIDNYLEKSSWYEESKKVYKWIQE